jgi:hypothetical protein
VPIWSQPPVVELSAVIIACHQRLLGRPLLADAPGDPLAAARALYEAPVVVVAHGTQPDPVFQYANRAAQALWGADWDGFTQMPSRLTAVPADRAERDRLLQLARDQGFIDRFRCERVTCAGRRFRIDDVSLWNLADGAGRALGQAATYARWTFLDP